MHCDLSNIGDIAKGFASLSSTYLTVYQLEKYDPFRYSQPPKNNVLLKVPMMFATNDTKVAKAGLLKTKSVHVLRIKSGIENVGIDLLFWDTSKDKCEFQDWCKYITEAGEISRQKLNRLNSVRNKISKPKFRDLVRRQSSEDILSSENGNWLYTV